MVLFRLPKSTADFTDLTRGPDLVAVYNEHYAPLACKAHPKLMSSTFRQGYPELWVGIRSIFEQCRTTGAGVNYSSEASLLVERKGWREETFFNGNFVPVGPAYLQLYVRSYAAEA